MRAKCFGPKWMASVAILLRSVSMKVVVNEVVGGGIAHVRRLRQGDPISPLLFVIAMDALSRIMITASAGGVLRPFIGIAPMQRLSIYADDVSLFVRPSGHDLRFVHEMLHGFGAASRLPVNYTKSSTIIIRGHPGR